MRVGPVILACLSLALSLPALGGVDGGNPKRQAFYNMAQNYRITNSDLIVTSSETHGSVRLDGPLTYRNGGHFIIATEDPATTGGEKICNRSVLNGTHATIFWIGHDCSHPYFERKFGELVEKVHKLPFSN